MWAEFLQVAKTFPESALTELVRLVHINPNNKLFLAKEFTQFWNKKAGNPLTISEISLNAISK